MTLLEGAGTGSVEKESGVLYEFSGKQLNDDEYDSILKEHPEYDLQNKEVAYCFKYFYTHYSKAKFSENRVVHAQKEIPKSDG